MLLSVIILNYNKSDLTLKCLKSLNEHYKNEFEKDNFEIIVVDNASQAEDIRVLRDTINSFSRKNLRLVENKFNAGFSKGCNLGAKIAKGDFLLFLNNDTEVKDDGLLKMVDYVYENNNVAVLGGKLSNMDGSQQPSVGKFYTLGSAFLLLLGLQRVGLVDKNPDQISEVDWVKGGCLMIKKSVFDDLAGFDEKIFMYTEDMELCYRAKKEGYRVFYYPHVKIVHVDQGSSSRSFAVVNIYQNLLYFYKKHRSSSEYMLLRLLLRTKAIFLITVGKLSHNNYLIQTYEKAFKVA